MLRSVHVGAKLVLSSVEEGVWRLFSYLSSKGKALYNDVPMQVVGRVGRIEVGLFVGPRYALLSVRCSGCGCEEVAEEFQSVVGVIGASLELIRAEASEELGADAVRCSSVLEELGIKLVREVRIAPNDMPLEVIHGGVRIPGVGEVAVVISGYAGAELYRLSVAITSPPRFSPRLLAREACNILSELRKLLKESECSKRAEALQRAKDLGLHDRHR